MTGPAGRAIPATEPCFELKKGGKRNARQTTRGVQPSRSQGEWRQDPLRHGRQRPAARHHARLARLLVGVVQVHRQAGQGLHRDRARHAGLWRFGEAAARRPLPVPPRPHHRRPRRAARASGARQGLYGRPRLLSHRHAQIRAQIQRQDHQGDDHRPDPAGHRIALPLGAAFPGILVLPVPPARHGGGARGFEPRGDQDLLQALPLALVLQQAPGDRRGDGDLHRQLLQARQRAWRLQLL